MAASEMMAGPAMITDSTVVPAATPATARGKRAPLAEVER
jgi:hypothetical protein